MESQDPLRLLRACGDWLRDTPEISRRESFSQLAAWTLAGVRTVVRRKCFVRTNSQPWILSDNDWRNSFHRSQRFGSIQLNSDLLLETVT